LDQGAERTAAAELGGQVVDAAARGAELDRRRLLGGVRGARDGRRESEGRGNGEDGQLSDTRNVVHALLLLRVARRQRLHAAILLMETTETDRSSRHA